jgi:hypothetical protein
MRWRGENRVPGGGDAGAVGEWGIEAALERAKARLRGWVGCIPFVCFRPLDRWILDRSDRLLGNDPREAVAWRPSVLMSACSFSRAHFGLPPS